MILTRPVSTQIVSGKRTALWSLLLIICMPEQPVLAKMVHPAWHTCLRQEARQLHLDPALLHALVYTESRNNPYAIGWTDQTGLRHSQFPTSADEAQAVITKFELEGQKYDLGLGQINSTNIVRLRRPLGLSWNDLLDPCHNLSATRFILHEHLTKYGYRWQAIAGYNGSIGSTKYIQLVALSICRQSGKDTCSIPDPNDPLPTRTQRPLTYRIVNKTTPPASPTQPTNADPPLFSMGLDLSNPSSATLVTHLLLFIMMLLCLLALAYLVVRAIFQWLSRIMSHLGDIVSSFILGKPSNIGISIPRVIYLSERNHSGIARRNVRIAGHRSPSR